MTQPLVTLTELTSYLNKIGVKKKVGIEDAQKYFSNKQVTQAMWVLATANRPSLSKREETIPEPVNKERVDVLYNYLAEYIYKNPFITKAELESIVGFEITKDTYSRACICAGGVNTFQRDLFNSLEEFAVASAMEGKDYLKEMTPENVLKHIEDIGTCRYLPAIKGSRFFQERVDSRLKGNSNALEANGEVLLSFTLNGDDFVRIVQSQGKKIVEIVRPK
jgi:hypothetical protein